VGIKEANSRLAGSHSSRGREKSSICGLGVPEVLTKVETESGYVSESEPLERTCRSACLLGKVSRF
jgi:hypothetical protein